MEKKKTVRGIAGKGTGEKGTDRHKNNKVGGGVTVGISTEAQNNQLILQLKKQQKGGVKEYEEEGGWGRVYVRAVGNLIAKEAKKKKQRGSGYRECNREKDGGRTPKKNRVKGGV